MLACKDFIFLLRCTENGLSSSPVVWSKDNLNEGKWNTGLLASVPLYFRGWSMLSLTLHTWFPYRLVASLGVDINLMRSAVNNGGL